MDAATESHRASRLSAVSAGVQGHVERLRAIAAHVDQAGVKLDGEVVALLPENQQRVAGAVNELLRRSRPAPPLKEAPDFADAPKRRESAAEVLESVAEVLESWMTRRTTRIGRSWPGCCCVSEGGPSIWTDLQPLKLLPTTSAAAQAAARGAPFTPAILSPEFLRSVLIQPVPSEVRPSTQMRHDFPR